MNGGNVATGRSAAWSSTAAPAASLIVVRTVPTAVPGPIQVSWKKRVMSTCATAPATGPWTVRLSLNPTVMLICASFGDAAGAVVLTCKRNPPYSAPASQPTKGGCGLTAPPDRYRPVVG